VHEIQPQRSLDADFRKTVSNEDSVLEVWNDRRHHELIEKAKLASRRLLS
jgi:hypothetical protein